MDDDNITDPGITEAERKGPPESDIMKLSCLNCPAKAPADCLVACVYCFESGCKECYTLDDDLGYFCSKECQIRSLEQARQKLEHQLAEAESAFYKKMGDIGRGIDELNRIIENLEQEANAQRN